MNTVAQTQNTLQNKPLMTETMENFLVLSSLSFFTSVHKQVCDNKTTRWLNNSPKSHMFYQTHKWDISVCLQREDIGSIFSLSTTGD